MFNVSVLYSIQFEINRVVDTFRQIDWLQENKYIVTLPIRLKVLYENRVLADDIESVVQEEFAENYYQESKDFLFKSWEEALSQAAIELAKTDLTTLHKYKIFLTRYGTGGSYHSPNEIIINIELIPKDDLLRDTIHEIVHLTIQSLIDLHHVNHWPKERLVDLIVAKISPSLINFQNLPIDTNAIDNIFAKNYPKVQQIIQDVAKLNI